MNCKYNRISMGLITHPRRIPLVQQTHHQQAFCFPNVMQIMKHLKFDASVLTSHKNMKGDCTEIVHGLQGEALMS